MEFIMTARSKEQENTDYLTLHEQGLNASVEILGGNGGIKNPFHAKVLINNENNAKWYGVIHVELPFNKVNPRYFMPAFMYGRIVVSVHRMFLMSFQDLERRRSAHPHLGGW